MSLDIVSIKIPEEQSGVYLLKLDGAIVYIGCSNRIFTRLGSHSKKVYDEIEIIWKPREEALKLEKELIQKHNPKYNVLWSNSPKPEHTSSFTIRISRENEIRLRNVMKLLIQRFRSPPPMKTFVNDLLEASLKQLIAKFEAEDRLLKQNQPAHD